jgi:hypothetical protein
MEILDRADNIWQIHVVTYLPWSLGYLNLSEDSLVAGKTRAVCVHFCSKKSWFWRVKAYKANRRSNTDMNYFGYSVQIDASVRWHALIRLNAIRHIGIPYELFAHLSRIFLFRAFKRNQVKEAAQFDHTTRAVLLAQFTLMIQKLNAKLTQVILFCRIFLFINQRSTVWMSRMFIPSFCALWEDCCLWKYPWSSLSSCTNWQTPLQIERTVINLFEKSPRNPI